jgi:hypothetical protein
VDRLAGSLTMWSSMSFVTQGGAALQAARQEATARFLAIAKTIKAEGGVVHHRLTAFMV